jgi:dienelactone hydrolase
MTKLTLLVMLTFTLFLAGCSDSTNYNFEQGIEETQANFNRSNIKAIFNPDPEKGEIPTTNDLLLGKDGTLNIPVKAEDSKGQKAVKGALNQLDGFSTTAPVTTAFNSSLDPESIKLGESVRVFELTKTGQQITGISAEVTSLHATATDPNNTTLAISPAQPLKPKTGYLVVLTNSLKGADGTPVSADTAYSLAKGANELTGDFVKLEPLRQAINGLEALANGAGIEKDTIVLSWTFTTQSIDDVMQKVFENTKTSKIVTMPLGKTTKDLLDPDGTNGIAGKADIHIGFMKVPYYLDAQTEINYKGPISGYWKGKGGGAVTHINPVPVKTMDLAIPVLISVPNDESAAGNMPPEGWPVVIFQHGVTGNRTRMLPIANAYADAGFMVVSIDMVLHGITDTNSPLHADNTDAFTEDVELSMGLDFVDNESGAKGPDGKPDSSGTHFINLESLLTGRDNIRQSVANLFVLRKSLANMARITEEKAILVDTTTVRFAGHSLGGIVGTDYLALDDTVGAASLFMPGGGIAQLLNNSESYGPRIKGGLAANGIIEGTPEFSAFMVAAQTVLDSADPINFAAAAAEKNKIHMIEVIGGNSGSPDQVIPNRVKGAPLSGTEPLAAVMKLPDVTVPGGTGSGIVRFTAGDHGSILSPEASPEATVEMQTETAVFLKTNGKNLPVTDSGVVQ